MARTVARRARWLADFADPREIYTGEGKRRKEFAEWYVAWRAEWHNYAKYNLRGE